MIERLFNKNNSIRFHEEFYFSILDTDTKLAKQEKKILVGRKFKCVGVKDLDKDKEFWLRSALNTEDTIMDLKTNEKLYYKRDKLKKLNPLIDTHKNPNCYN